MEEVVIITRDINGKRTDHFLKWGKVVSYIQDNIRDDDEILVVVIENSCIYSSLFQEPITKDDLIGFFA